MFFLWNPCLQTTARKAFALTFCLQARSCLSPLAFMYQILFDVLDFSRLLGASAVVHVLLSTVFWLLPIPAWCSPLVPTHRISFFVGRLNKRKWEPDNWHCIFWRARCSLLVPPHSWKLLCAVRCRDAENNSGTRCHLHTSASFCEGAAGWQQPTLS